MAPIDHPFAAGPRPPTLTRRQALAVARGAAAAATLGLAPTGARAEAPAVHRMPFGPYQVIVISDGHLVLPGRMAAQDVPPDALETVLASAGLSSGENRSPVNVTLLETPGGLIAIDVGAGPNFMPTAGKLGANLEAAGIDRKAVTKVVFTHAHADHLWGALDDFDETPVFPNAEHMIGAAEWDLWHSGDVFSRIPPGREPFVTGARRILGKLKDGLRMLKPGDDIAPGVRAIDTAGHTQGHLSIEIVAGSEALIVLGDALTNPAVSFQHPEWKPVSDHDPDRAVATRKRLLDRLATDRSRLIGTHLPFPGLGRAERAGQAYRLVPA